MTGSDHIAEDHRTEASGVWPAGSLLGNPVRTREGEPVGKVEDIMLDLHTGRVAYVVLSFGGFLGIGDKLFAVPWDALALDESVHELLIDVNKRTLESAPGFDKNAWPDMADTGWEQTIHAHYGQPFFRSRQDAGSELKVRTAGSSAPYDFFSPDDVVSRDTSQTNSKRSTY